MRVAAWSLVALSLSVSACAAPPPVTVAVPNQSAAAAHRIWEEAPDYMIEVALPSGVAEAPPTPAALAASVPRSESAAAVQITSSTPTPPRPVATPRPAAATPRPTATPSPSAPTPAPTSVANCKFSQALSEGDGTVRAAQVPPALFYGGGLCTGDRVEALIAGKSCGTSTVDAAGQWSISIRSTAPCAPMENAAVAFTINGNAAPVSPAAVWKSGGLPPDVAGGYTLTR